MNAKFIYILIFLIVVILYELYLIGFYKYQEFQTNIYVESLTRANEEIEKRNREKESLNTYIRTKAYQTLVAKATQNKKLPGEEIVNIVDESSTQGNDAIDINEMLFDIRKKEDSPTKNMSNPEKWRYIYLHIRDYF